MKWDIDKAIKSFEAPGLAPGTTITRTLMDVEIMKREGLKPTADHIKNGQGMVWSVAIGRMGLPKVFFYGLTIRAAFLRAKKKLVKVAKAERVALGLPNLKAKRRKDLRKPMKKVSK